MKLCRLAEALSSVPEQPHGLLRQDRLVAQLALLARSSSVASGAVSHSV